VDWQQGFSADAKIDWLDFPWHRLYPVIDEPEVVLRTFNGEVSYKDGNYLGNSRPTSMARPANSAWSAVQWRPGQVFLPQLKLVTAGQGKAEGHLNVQFAEGVAWDTALDLSALNPAYWVAELPGTLAGPLRSKGEFKNEQLKLNANLDLKGRLRGQTAVLAAKAEGAGEQWTLANLDIRLGDNRINGSGSLQQRLAGQIDIKLARLAQLWPLLRGQVNGRLDVAGTLKAPQGKLTSMASNWCLPTTACKPSPWMPRLITQQRAKIDLKGTGIQAGDTQLGVL
jgi:translocation and assembly module TamB